MELKKRWEAELDKMLRVLDKQLLMERYGEQPPEKIPPEYHEMFLLKGARPKRDVK